MIPLVWHHSFYNKLLVNTHCLLMLPENSEYFLPRHLKFKIKLSEITFQSYVSFSKILPYIITKFNSLFLFFPFPFICLPPEPGAGEFLSLAPPEWSLAGMRRILMRLGKPLCFNCCRQSTFLPFPTWGQSAANCCLLTPTGGSHWTDATPKPRCRESSESGREKTLG